MIIAEQSDSAVRAVIDRWLTKVSEHDFAGALALLIPRTKWNAALLEAAIGRTFEGTPSVPRFTVEWFHRARRDGAIGFAEITIPSNGARDLTATFNIVEMEDGIRLALEDVEQGGARPID